MGRVARGSGPRPGRPTTQTRPVSKRTLIVLGGIVLVLGLLVQTEANVPPLALATVGILGALALFIIGLQRPEIPLYVMTAFLPFSKKLAGDFGGVMSALNLTNILIVILLMGYFLTTAGRKDQPLLERHPLHWPVLALALWGTLSFYLIASSIGPKWFAKYLPEFKRWLDPFVIYFLYFHIVRDRARWKTVVLIMMFCVGLVGLMATHEYMGVGEGTSLEQARVGSIAGQPNVLGAFFVYYMFLFPAFWLVNLQRAKAWWLLVPFLLCFRGIMVTFSRGAYVSFLAGLLGFAYFRHKLLALLTAGTIAFVALNPWLLPPGIRYRWDSTFRSDTSLIDAYGTGAQLQEQVDLSSRLRLIIWEGGLKMIQDYPWFGVGYRRFRFRIGEYIIWKRPIDAHNAYLLMAAEFGIPALVFFVLVILLLVRITWVVYRRHPDAFIRTAAHGFLGGLSALALANVFGSRLNTAEVSGYFWILAALMARAHVWVRQPAPEPLAPAQAARRAARVRLPRRRLRAIRAEAA